MKDLFATLPAPMRRWGKTLAILGAALATYVGTALLGTLLTGDPIAGAALSSLVALVMALAYRWGSTGSLRAGRASPRARTGQFWLAAAAGLVSCWLLGQTAAVWLYSAIGSEGFDAVSQTRMDSPVWLVLLTGILLAPIGEEALIRGIAYPVLRRHWPVMAAAVLSAVVFALLHGNLVQIALTVPLGVLLALVYEHSQRLWPVIAMHVLFNVASTLTPPAFVSAIANPFMIVGFAAMVVLSMYALARATSESAAEQGDQETAGAGSR
ncbi:MULTISPECIES: type II CAAX endopeptidase family protein [unclassified Microbacterium]|uniref:CPBP family intramembrane glutamic endopeptidase n=1 Tax=unclassified Microbacterium TaxID=2609290 RepID=UPI002883500D|nr:MULTISPECIES: type II CAAX endopeptidase family protein [unclassified Microbacterium]